MHVQSTNFNVEKTGKTHQKSTNDGMMNNMVT